MINLRRYFSLKSRYRRVKRRLFNCCLIILLTVVLTCVLLVGLSVYLAQLAAAQDTAVRPIQVMLLIDNSNSMYEKGGLGSDPGLLRIEAARLFITYLGVDDRLTHQLGVVFFGGESRLVAPFTPLTDDARRAELAQLIANPPRMAWTNHQVALELAEHTFQAAAAAPAQRAVVLLTDGKSEWSNNPAAEEKAAVIARLRDTAGRFAAQGIPLFIILLQNAATDADPEIESAYVPLWQEMAALTPPGRFYRARQSEELLDIYHDIVVTLSGRQTAGMVVQTQVQTETVEQIEVESGLAQVTFVIRKSEPTLQVTILRPTGQPLDPTESDLQYAGQPSQSLEEIWAVTDPQPGTWQVHLNGQGTVTVWKDFLPALPTLIPTASPTFIPSPTPTAIPIATMTPFPTITRTPTPSPTTNSVVHSTSIQPSPPINPPADNVPPPNSPRSAWTWSWVVLAMLALLAGAGWLWLRRQSPPLLEGTLRRLTTPPQAANPTIPAHLDLDALRRKMLRIGPSPQADLSLPSSPDRPTPAASLVARRDPNGQIEIVLVIEPTSAGNGQVLVNQLPVTSEWLLRDHDVVELGAYRFRYENLQRRAKRFGDGRMVIDNL